MGRRRGGRRVGRKKPQKDAKKGANDEVRMVALRREGAGLIGQGIEEGTEGERIFSC